MSKKFKVVRTYKKGCNITTDLLEKAFYEGWQYVSFSQLQDSTGINYCNEYILSKEEEIKNE